MSNKRIAIQGIKASFHDLAARKYFGEEIDLVECYSFKELCESLNDPETDFAVMAIENTIAGSLLPNYALLEEYRFKIIGEVYLHIQMNLMALPGVKLEDVKHIISHPIAIRQCDQFLWNLKDKKVTEKPDTAACAKDIADNNWRKSAAIANELSADTYGLEILERRIETNKQNFTRFLVLSNRTGIDETNNKSSIRFQLGHTVGSLADVLTTFREFNINMTKIQSIPVIGKPYEYSFNIDLEYDNYQNYRNAIQATLHQVEALSILGEYKKGKLQLNNCD